MSKITLPIALLLLATGAFYLTMGVLYKYEVIEDPDVAQIADSMKRHRPELPPEEFAREIAFYRTGLAKETFEECLVVSIVFLIGGLGLILVPRLIKRLVADIRINREFDEDS